jgi:hypothetical protein
MKEGQMGEHKNKPKSVLMACPTFGLEKDPNQWLVSFLGALNEFSMRRFRVNTYFPYRRPIIEAENQIAQMAITTGADYIFRMDDDIWGFRPGYINNLIDADKEFISGVMFVAGFPFSRCAFVRKDKGHDLPYIYKNKLLELDEVEGKGVVPCDLTATPFTLIKTTIFEKILTPYYATMDGVAPDSLFCQKLLDAGIQPYVHMDVQLNHRHVTHWNRHYLYNAEARALLKSGMLRKGSAAYEILEKEFGPTGELDMLMIKGVKISDA